MKYLLIYLKGIAMGAADVVPGVSGGTIAFITGILQTLLDSIGRIRPSLFTMIKSQGIKAAFLHINGPFLVALLAGILTSVATLAKLISWLLVAHPIPIWSFFFGLIIVSVIHMLRQLKSFSLFGGLLFVLGATLAWLITRVHPIDLDPTYFNIFLGGAIAICAIVLPGLSGSFILLLLGLYTSVLGAVKELNIALLATFLAGAVIGILCFSRLLSALLRKYHDLTLLFLTGLMLGTLGKIWPWKQVLSWRVNSHGEQVPLLEQNLLPASFEQITQQSPQLILAVISFAAAFILVLTLEFFADKRQQ